MAEDKIPKFAEDDELATARAFWKENGKSIIVGIALGLSGIVGFNYWQVYQQHQAESASELYDQIKPGVDAINAMTVADELKESFSSSIYSSLGAFSLAKILVEEDKLDLAASELDWVLKNTDDEAIQHIARIRLASVYIAEQKFNEVIVMLDGINQGVFESRYQELIGDAYSIRNSDGDIGKARVAYQKSLDTLPGGSGQSGLLQLKLDNLGDS